MATTLGTGVIAALMVTTGDVPRREATDFPRPSRIEHSTFAASGWYGFDVQVSKTAEVARKVRLTENRVLPSRPTSTREEIIGEIRTAALLKANWDGEGGAAPDARSHKDATLFVQLMNDEMPLPETMLHATGRAGLFWNDDGLYADLEFLGDHRVAYYVEKDGDKHKGVVTIGKDEMPGLFLALIRV
jgi:hypothetical protein